MPTLLQNAELAFMDPTGDNRRKIQQAIVELPARMRAVASMRSSLVRSAANGANPVVVSDAWAKVNRYADELFKLDQIARRGWEEARRQGWVTGDVPEITIAEPDRPAGLSGYTVVVAIAAALVIVVVAAILLFLTAITGGMFAVVAVVAGVIVVAAAASESTANVAAAVNSPNAGRVADGVATASSALAIGTIAVVAFLIFGRKSK